MDQAASIWKMLDDMAESNPEQYKQFMQEQMSGMGGNGAKQKVSEIPTESFCVRIRGALFKPPIKPPTAEESGTVSVAIGVPRAVEEPKKKKKQQQSIESKLHSFAVDVVVSGSTTRRAEMDEGFSRRARRGCRAVRSRRAAR